MKCWRGFVLVGFVILSGRSTHSGSLCSCSPDLEGFIVPGSLLGNTTFCAEVTMKSAQMLPLYASNRREVPV